jgi:hypothetical protein
VGHPVVLWVCMYVVSLTDGQQSAQLLVKTVTDMASCFGFE